MIRRELTKCDRRKCRKTACRKMEPHIGMRAIAHSNYTKSPPSSLSLSLPGLAWSRTGEVGGVRVKSGRATERQDARASYPQRTTLRYLIRGSCDQAQAGAIQELIDRVRHWHDRSVWPAAGTSPTFDWTIAFRNGKLASGTTSGEPCFQLVMIQLNPLL